MAIVFPRPFPIHNIRTVVFDLQRYTSQNNLYGGKTQTREMAEPRWQGTFTTAPLTRTEGKAWKAWKDTLRGGNRPFLAYDPSAPYPAAYKNFDGLVRAQNGLDFNGTAVVTNLNDQFQIGMRSLPAGFRLTVGDMIGLVQDGKYGLFRIVESVLATAGGLATVDIEPRVVPGFFTQEAVIHLYRPMCQMIFDNTSWSYTDDITDMPASFTGIQRLY